jgi:hypothetical protein
LKSAVKSIYPDQALNILERTAGKPKKPEVGAIGPRIDEPAKEIHEIILPPRQAILDSLPGVNGSDGLFEIGWNPADEAHSNHTFAKKGCQFSIHCWISLGH